MVPCQNISSSDWRILGVLCIFCYHFRSKGRHGRDSPINRSDIDTQANFELRERPKCKRWLFPPINQLNAGPCVQGVLDRCRALDPGCVKSSQTAKGGDTFGFDSIRILGFGKGRGKGTKREKKKNALVSPKVAVAF